jgi:lysozyme
MDVANRQKLIRLIEQQEGLKTHIFTATNGHLSIGIGRDLSVHGISVDEALYLLQNDILAAESSLSKCFPEYNTLDDIRKIVVINLVFTMGIASFMQFAGMIAAIRDHDFVLAAKHLLDSNDAKLAPHRAEQLAFILERGEL